MQTAGSNIISDKATHSHTQPQLPATFQVGCGARWSVQEKAAWGLGLQFPRTRGPRVLELYRPQIALGFERERLRSRKPLKLHERMQPCLLGHLQVTAGINPGHRDCGSLLMAAQLQPIIRELMAGRPGWVKGWHSCVVFSNPMGEFTFPGSSLVGGKAQSPDGLQHEGLHCTSKKDETVTCSLLPTLCCIHSPSGTNGFNLQLANVFH